MKLKNITINNYKSFGENDNFLFLDKLNAVIGKNESGKSNIVDAIVNIGEIGKTNEKYFLPKNRKNNGNINVILNFETYESEKVLYGFEGNACVTVLSHGNYALSGDLSEFILNSEQYSSIISKINEVRKSGISIQQQEDRSRFSKMVEELENAGNRIFILWPSYMNVIQGLKKSNNQSSNIIASLIEEAIEFLKNIYSIFPKFIKIEDTMLSSKYNMQNISLDTLLGKFCFICNIDMEELINKIQSTDAVSRRNYERDINNNIKHYFTDEFNRFYTQENVKIEFVINSKEFNIMVDTTNRYLDYDERSNGLRWYLSAFIQLEYMKKKFNEDSDNYIIVMDEPGVYLHPNAQREIVKLFNELIKRDNQIIYTTHSPFMLDTNALQNVRAVIKDEDGFTHIYNKITTIPNSSKSKFDTITPLANAIGLNLNYNIGPSFEKKNIIVEGITDYFYLQGYFKCKNENEIPNIIPSTGADNVPAIASILFGWKCDFNILLDQDDKGRLVYDSINDSKQLFAENIIFVDGNTTKISDKDFMIEDLLSESDKVKFGITQPDYKDNKYNYSYDTYNKILSAQETYDSETMQNFEQLLKKIDLSNEK